MRVISKIATASVFLKLGIILSSWSNSACDREGGRGEQQASGCTSCNFHRYTGYIVGNILAHPSTVNKWYLY